MAPSETQELFRNYSPGYTLLSFTIWVHLCTITKRRLLYDPNKSKWIDWYCRKMHHSEITISTDRNTSVHVHVYIWIDVCAYMYICVCICVFLHTHRHTHIYIYIYLWYNRRVARGGGSVCGRGGRTPPLPDLKMVNLSWK